MLLRWSIRLLFVVAVLYMLLLIAVANSPEANAVARAIVGMAWVLFLLWVVIGGAIMLRYRDRIRQHIHAINLSWQMKFVLFATLLALIEEAITTTMTNLAPLFGVKMGEAAITASANYLEVVLFHSVIVFIPMFIGWAWLLNRYDFSPKAVFFLFGITGTLSEWITFGMNGSSPISFAFWLFIYGLMVYLPAYSLPSTRTLRPARLYHAVLAVIFPVICSVPVVIGVMFINQLRQSG